jgi:hypothetical protein
VVCLSPNGWLGEGYQANPHARIGVGGGGPSGLLSLILSA